MGQTLTILDIVRDLFELNDELVIFAVEPWTPESPAMLIELENDFDKPAAAVEAGMTYFIEVFIAQDFLEFWVRNDHPPLRQVCDRLIYYAAYDA